MSLKKRTVVELEDLLAETKLKFKEKIREIQYALDVKKMDDENEILRNKAQNFEQQLKHIQEKHQSEQKTATN